MDNSNEKDRKKSPIDLIESVRSSVANFKNISQSGQQLLIQGATSNAKWYIGGVLLIAAFIYIMFFDGGGSIPFDLGSNDQAQPKVSTAPNVPSENICQPSSEGSNGGSLDYSIPFKDSSKTPQAVSEVQKQILATWPGAKLQNWDTIVEQSIQNGWNPSFVLTLWVEESGGQSGISKAEGNPTGYTDALGCDPLHPTSDINKSLSCLFNSFKTYSPSQFEDFMCVYGGDGFHKAPCTFDVENKYFPGGIKTWYSNISSGGTTDNSSDVKDCVQPSGQPVASGGWPTSGILTQGPKGALDHAGILSSTGHPAVDIADPQGPPVNSPFKGVVTSIHNCIDSGDCFVHYGNSVEITTNSESGSFSVLYGHLSNYNVSLNQEINAGEKIGTMGTTGYSTGIHLHWEFKGIPMQPPYIPQAITPEDCDTPSIPCSPVSIKPGV